jgi:hypothetical protein
MNFQSLAHATRGRIQTPAGAIPLIDARLQKNDIRAGWKMRWDVGRMDYAIAPGLYAVGNPDGSSPVMVTANYKLSFDSLRRELAAFSAWILVLDCKGINVWCAAGKGTFGTDELVRSIGATRLSEVVSHRVLILPQLAAPGVAAHEVIRRSGFRVLYGPVRASDLPAFLHAGNRATPAMRRVRFAAADRLATVPVELMQALRYFPYFLIAIVLLHLPRLRAAAILGDAFPVTAAIFSGTVLMPLLLPWLPGRAFSVKGLWTGLALWLLCRFLLPWSLSEAMAWMLLVGAISAFLALNYTGASAITSLSGVKKEMRLAIPAIIAAAAAGIILRVILRFTMGG